MGLIKVSEILDLFPSIKKYFDEALVDFMPEKYSPDEQPDSEYHLGSHIIMLVLTGQATIELSPQLIEQIVMRLKTDGAIDDEAMAEYMKTSLRWKELFK